jgi:hypothetical protein
MTGEKGRVKFVFAVHSHQPVGNFDFVLKEAYESCYLPFLKVLGEHPTVKANLHYSGCLLEWIRENRPEYLGMIREMVKTGQLEILTGGFYEPILPIIPDEDKLAQIQMQSNFIWEEFGYEPVGLWLPERVWEPHLPKPLSRAGVRYLIVDDTHFKFSGLEEDELYGYYLTEEEGYGLALFPSSKRLRYMIPFRPVEEFIDFMGELSQREEVAVITYGDDGEKFGVWPGTNKHCYQDGWLEEFLSALEENSELVESVHISELMKSVPPLGRVYLPTASYAEMMQWALPAGSYVKLEDFEKQLKEQELFEGNDIFVRGGFWRNFLAKYPESNNMHKKMLWVGEKVRRMTERELSGEEESLLNEINRERYRGQCNCAYWHGVFGGLYLPHLRTAVYKHLINAEKLADWLRPSGDGRVDVHQFDFDRDGRDELTVETPKLSLYFKPDSGGSLFELDYKPRSINLLDTLTRREEGYHRRLLEPQPRGNPETAESIHDRLETKESGLEKMLFYDWYDRKSLLDHFLGEETTLDSFSKSRYPEKGDFVDQPYQLEVRDQAEGKEVHLRREGHIWVGAQWIPITVEKILNIPSDGAQVEILYRLLNTHHPGIDVWFGVEFNLSMLEGGRENSNLYVEGEEPSEGRLDDSLELRDCRVFGAYDRTTNLKIAIETETPADLWCFPIETVSLSESGFERNYQSTVLFPNWRLHLPRENPVQLKLVKRISEG